MIDFEKEAREIWDGLELSKRGMDVSEISERLRSIAARVEEETIHRYADKMVEILNALGYKTKKFPGEFPRIYAAPPTTAKGGGK